MSAGGTHIWDFKPMFNLFIKNKISGDIFELPFLSLGFTEELNNGADARISFDYAAIDQIAKSYGADPIFLLTGGFRELWIQKDTTKVFYGAITDFDLTASRESDLTINVAAVNFFNLFSKRRTANKRVFTGTDSSQIAWTLINESQAVDAPYSDLGITAGSLAVATSRDALYRFAYVKDEIVALSNKKLNNGFDFDIDTSKRFNTYFPFKGSSRPSIVFDERNSIEHRYRKPLMLSLTNKIYVTGEGINDDMIYTTRTSDPSYRTAFGTLEDLISDRTETSQAKLNDLGDRTLLNNQSPRIELSISHIDDDPDLLSYGLGDSVRVNLPDLKISNQYFRIYKRSLNLEEGNLPVITITLQ